MTRHLLDASVLIALTVSDHEHHERCRSWLLQVGSFALSPVVEGALVRFLLRLGERPQTAVAVLRGLHGHHACEVWVDDLSYADVDLSGVLGHRQVTDAYLASLAAAHGGVLATLDEGLHSLRPVSTLLIPPLTPEPG